MQHNLKEIAMYDYTKATKQYQELFDKMLAKIEISVIESRKLTLLRDWLLPMLMNGQVVVANKVEI